MANAKQCDACKAYFIPRVLPFDLRRSNLEWSKWSARVQFYDNGSLADLCAGCTIDALINLVSLMRQELEEAKSNVG